jgi:hypothetical protein
MNQNQSEVERQTLELLKSRYHRGKGTSFIVDAGEMDFLFRLIDRLSEGDFSPSELQNLCHNLNVSDANVFCDGCERYQQKLFGQSPITDLKHRNELLKLQNEVLKARHDILLDFYRARNQRIEREMNDLRNEVAHLKQRLIQCNRDFIDLASTTA